MPANRMTMRKIKEVLRLKWACGLSHRQISKATGVSVGAVSQYAAMAKAAELDWPQADGLDEDTLEQRLFGAQKPTKLLGLRAMPDFAHLHRELRRKGVPCNCSGRNTWRQIRAFRSTSTRSSAAATGTGRPR